MISYQLMALDAGAEFVIKSGLVNRQPLPVATNDRRMSEGPRSAFAVESIADWSRLLTQ